MKELREKIKELIKCPPRKDKCSKQEREHYSAFVRNPVCYDCLTDQIHSFYCEKLNKSLLTDEEIHIEARARTRFTWLEYGKDIAQAQLENSRKVLEG